MLPGGRRGIHGTAEATRTAFQETRMSFEPRTASDLVRGRLVFRTGTLRFVVQGGSLTGANTGDVNESGEAPEPTQIRVRSTGLIR